MERTSCYSNEPKNSIELRRRGRRRDSKKKGSANSPALAVSTLWPALEAVLSAQVLQILFHHLSLHSLLQLRLYFLEAWDFGVADVVELNNVPAELRLHRRGRELALLQRDHGVAKRLYEIRRRIPIEIAAVGLGAGVLGALRKLFELLAFGGGLGFGVGLGLGFRFGSGLALRLLGRYGGCCEQRHRGY